MCPSVISLYSSTMTDHYLTISTPGEGLYTEKRSRFLAFAIHVESEEEIKEIVKKYQKDYYDARHVCYAYALGYDRERTRGVDAGEPSGTAGRPILGQIKSKKLTNILVIVVRYYGGTPLGVANLGRAYQAAALEALSQAVTEEKIVTKKIRVSVPYTDVDAIMKVLREEGAEIFAREYDSREQHLTVTIPLNGVEHLCERLKKFYTVTIHIEDNEE